MIVRVPGSSANLGPGFDSLGLAVSWWVDIGSIDTPAPPRARPANDRHPAAVAHRRAGGDGRIWVREGIPMGRGLGYSGAVRVGGATLAIAQRAADPVSAIRADARTILAWATELDGHPDNVAASLYGGFVAVAAGRAVRVPLAVEPSVVVWVPDTVTRTDQSRSRLATSVAMSDAVFNVGRTALLVAALAVGDIDALRDATTDRLHQDVRLADQPVSRAALESGLEAGAWCGWLSGSGPTVAFLVDPATASQVLAALPQSGRAHELAIDQAGATLIDASD